MPRSLLSAAIRSHFNMAEDTGSRSSFGGSFSDLAECLAPCATDVQLQCVRDPPRVEDRRQKQRRMLKMGPVLRTLEKLQHNIPYPKSTMDKTLKKVLNDTSIPSALIGDQHKEAFRLSEAMHKACRFVQQARTNNPPAACVKHLFNPGPLSRWASGTLKRPAARGQATEEHPTRAWRRTSMKRKSRLKSHQQKNLDLMLLMCIAPRRRTSRSVQVCLEASRWIGRLYFWVRPTAASISNGQERQGWETDLLALSHG